MSLFDRNQEYTGTYYKLAEQNSQKETRRRDISVGTAMGYGMDDWISIPSRVKRFLFTPNRSDRLWPPTPSLLLSGNRGLFPDIKRPGPKTDHSPLYNIGAHLHSHIRRHGLVLNELSTGTTLLT
jgi:hypothetical protein